MKEDKMTFEVHHPTTANSPEHSFSLDVDNDIDLEQAGEYFTQFLRGAGYNFSGNFVLVDD